MNIPFSSFFKIALGFIVFLFLFSSYYIISPGERGVKVTLGVMSEEILKPGLGFKMPFLTSIYQVNVQQETQSMKAECFSSDLQQVNMDLGVLYRIPESSTISVLRDYKGDIFESLVMPRIQESLKEVTAQKSAQDIVKTREQIKIEALKGAKEKIGTVLIIEDLVINDISLSKELEDAIEAKMVQQQEAEKAVFKLQQAKIDADTAIIAAKGQAESIRIQGEALEKNSKLIDLKMIEKWNGITPQVVGAGSNIMLPVLNNK